MPNDLVVPPLGESITEAVVGRWLKKFGEPVEADESVIELETDKVTMELPSPVRGVLTDSSDRENTILSAGIPARSARTSSPPETMSAPAPRRASSRKSASAPLALTA